MHRDLARHLRKNLTDTESRLWQALRYRQMNNCKFRRQASIGPYIADFVCFEQKLILELDGGQHAETVEEDATRTEWLKEQGFTVLRFWNHQVFEELESVLEVIWRAVTPPPHPNPPPQGGREKESTPSPTRGEGERSPSPQPSPTREGERIPSPTRGREKMEPLTLEAQP